MKKSTTFKLLGIGGTVLGLASTLMSNAAATKEMEVAVAEEVKKALAKKNK